MAKPTLDKLQKMTEEPKRARVKQADVPKHSLREAFLSLKPLPTTMLAIPLHLIK
jgi:hypothetical protein